MHKSYTFASSSIPPKTLISGTGIALMMRALKPYPCPEPQMAHTAFYLLFENGISGTSLRLHKILVANYLTFR